MSNRPAEHSDGDRSTRNAAFGAEIIRFRAIRGHLGPERPLPRRCRNPGRLRRLRRHVAHVLRVRQRPARHQRQRPHRAARPRSRRFRRPADIRESSKFRRDTKDPSHHRLAPSRQASGCERVREFVDAPPHGCIAESAHCLATPRRRAHRFSRSRGAGRGRSMGRVRQRDPRGVARMPLRARRGGGEERLPLPGVSRAPRSLKSCTAARVFARTPSDALREPCPRRAHLIEITNAEPPSSNVQKTANRRNPNGRARGPAKPRAARRDRDGFPRFLDESIALVEFSKHGRSVWSRIFKFAYIDVALKMCRVRRDVL